MHNGSPKNVLVIAHHFPPLKSVGIYRTLRYIKHFKENNLNPVVLTIGNPDLQFNAVDFNADNIVEFDYPVYRVNSWYVKPLWHIPAMAALCR